MAQIETLGILQDLESLLSDQLQVVSYKWLSRNYLLPSNDAKRLLQEFVEKHGNGFEVVYALSGWLRSNPPSYHIRLVSGPKLAEAKQEFDGSCSVQVYSVQACIPKDPAVLWNAEFVQAEELFKQPSTVDNCLRDNRFCAISNSFIKRNVEGTPLSVSAPQLQSGVGLGQSKSNLTHQNAAVQQSLQDKKEQFSSKLSVPSPNVVKEVKSESNGTGVNGQVNKPPTNKEKVPSVPANKKKVLNNKSSSGTEGSLANFWSRASAKSKATCPSETSNGASADAQICAREAVGVEGVSSDDDGQDMNFKRASNGEGTRKRRVVIDFSDDEYEDAVNLASPDTGKSGRDLKQSIEALVPEKSNLNFDKHVEDKLKVKENAKIDHRSPLVKDNSSAVTSDRTTGTSPKDRTRSSVPENDLNEKDKLTKNAPDSPKRRKVLKTRIDERGREVTEVIWEGEETVAEKAKDGTAEKPDSGAMNKVENNTVSSNVNRASAAKKSPAVGNTAPSNQTGKPANKKTGNKDPKQGNILSFFKRV
ncbi:DNA polymerase subunit Cdc [Trema orientale]|uniref:DNA polymerase delta subunit 3 n=1 Tax=Trema orientale TaxID=63057 RepID=A0A2P5FL22_TREOI|nr:DNA polymerase subunit Cdc [Trema orientale]